MSHKIFGLIFSITLLASLIGIFPTPVVLAAVPIPTAPETPYAADHLIVKLREEVRVEKGSISTHIASLDKALAEMEAVALEAVPGLQDTYLVMLNSESADILSAVNTLNNDPAVEYAELDYLAKLDTAPVLTAPSQTDSANVLSVTLNPASPVGIQTVSFTVEFSKPMDMETEPRLVFQSVLHNTWTVYDTSNSGLPNNGVYAIAVDPDGTKWFGTFGGGVARFDGTNWTVYNTSNSGLPNPYIFAIAGDADGSHWFGMDGGAAHFDGTNWTVYNAGNSGLPFAYVYAIAVDADGSHWFGTWVGGVAHFDGTDWTVYDTGNSGLPNNTVRAIVVDADGAKWFGTDGGVARYDGTWTVYNTDNSDLPNNEVYAIAIDSDGSIWFATYGGGVAQFDGTTWTVYNEGNSGLPDDRGQAIAIDTEGSKWFGIYDRGVAQFDDTTWTVYNEGNSGLPDDTVYAIAIDVAGSKVLSGTRFKGVGVLGNYPTHTIQNNPVWLDATHFQATYDITTLIERGDYRLTVADAVDGDGMTIVPDSSTIFTVDYDAAISDTTPPVVPVVLAWGDGSLTQLTARAYASDPDSDIVEYRYAIGTTPGGSNAINWTNTSYAQITHTGLILQPDQAYYVSFQARNVGGLWSPIGVSNPVVNGAGLSIVFLPSIRR